MAKKKTIGRREIVDFPELGILGIEAKIDTGAYTSAIHCCDVQHFIKEGKEFISFLLLDPTHPQYENKTFVWPLFEHKEIKNSFGQKEERFSILTKMMIYGTSINVELSLADRSQMEYPVLLGRKVLSKRFLVDVSKKNLSFKSKSQKSK